MNNRYVICKCISFDCELYAVVDYYHDLFIRWCTSLEAASFLCNSLNADGIEYE